MWQLFFVIGAAFYVMTGLGIGVLSMRVWRSRDSVSRLSHFLFPWNAHDGCVGGTAAFSVFGELERHAFAPVPIYLALLSLFWPAKLVWCFCTKIFITFFYH